MTTTAPEELTAAELAVWVESFTLASEQLKESTAEAAQEAWLSFNGWYNAALVAALAAQMADLSQAAQQTTAGLASQYVIGAVGAMGAPTPGIPNPWQPIRFGAPMNLVHTRPAEAYRRAIARGLDHQTALKRAGLRASNLMLSDLTLQDRAAMAATMRAMGITQFRRIVRPELSKSGSCGLCIVAADRIYSIGDLMPIHPPSCKCIVAPIVGDNDPGKSLNREDLDALYAAAGSNKAADLARTRYQVNMHGELGPILTREGDNFKSPDDVPLESNPERARKMLDAIEPVLAKLEARAAGGEDVTGPLKYQRDLVERLRRIVGD